MSDTSNPPSNFIFTTVPLEQVYTYDRIKYNVNNLWENNEPPADYHEVLERTYCRHWVDIFHSNYRTIEIPIKSWMIEAQQTGFYTGKFSRLYNEDLQDLIVELKERIGVDVEWKEPKFPRLEAGSLKGTMHGRGPYCSLKPIIESILSCRQGHHPKLTVGKTLTVYLLDYIEDLVIDWEFRLFIKDRRLVAVSQQGIYKPHPDPAKLMQRAELIVSYTTDVIIPKLKGLRDYTVDLALLGPERDQPYFIETNSYGGQYAAGSALFHWTDDSDLLEGKLSSIEFRYVML